VEECRQGSHSSGGSGRRVPDHCERFVYPGEAIIVAFALAIVPYLILRGLVSVWLREIM
jgi:hypothetical protein